MTDSTRQTNRRRVFLALGIAAVAGILIFLAVGGIGDNLVYYWSPSELVSAGDDAKGASVRLGGLVAAGTVVRGDDGLALDFAVTDGDVTVPVRASTVPPAMFREGIGVVLEGRLAEDGVFETTRLMVKHDNEYQPPGEGEYKSMEDLVETLQFEASDT